MTREEIETQIQECAKVLCNGDFKDKQDMDNITFKREILMGKLEVFDDFESRICENCRWYKDLSPNKDAGLACKLWDIAFTKDFGCNKWEKK